MQGDDGQDVRSTDSAFAPAPPVSPVGSPGSLGPSVMPRPPRLPRSPLGAVVLDVDGTLYDAAPVRRAMLRRLLSAYWYRPWTGRRVIGALQAFRHALEDVRTAGAAGGCGAIAQLRLASERSGVPEDELRGLVERWMLREPLPHVAAARRHGLLDCLDRLRADGVRIGVFSDYPVEAKLEALGVVDRVDFALHTGQNGVERHKPAPDGIEAVLDVLGVHPDHAVYVGDRDDVDAPAAEAAGVACVLVARRPEPGVGWIGTGDFDTVTHILTSEDFRRPAPD